MTISRNKVDYYTDSIAFSFGREVLAKREELGISRNQLSKLALISYKWLVAIEKGRKIPSVYIITSISMALDYYDWEVFKLKASFGYAEDLNTMYISYMANNPLNNEGTTPGTK